LIAALLHDVLETVMIIFGKAMWKLKTICKEVADIVLELTSDNNEN
jgi:hypothetical protein